MISKRILLLLSICTLLVVCLCLTGCLTECGPDAREVRALTRMNPSQRRAVFASMSPNRQLDIFLYAALKMEPGRAFLDDVAVNWRTVLPIIKARLVSNSTRDAERTELLWLLATIADRYCSLAQRGDILTVASQAVAKMDPARKPYAEEPLRLITHPNLTKALPPCQ